MSIRILIVDDGLGPRRLLRRELEAKLESLDWGVWPGADSDRRRLFDIVAVDDDEVRTIVESSDAELVQLVRRTWPRRAAALDMNQTPPHPVAPAPAEGIDVVVLDLALNDAQGEALNEAGGRRAEPSDDLDDALARTTGFRLLRVLVDGGVPVVVTTLASNPRVRELCKAAGALAVVNKPHPDDDMLEAIGGAYPLEGAEPPPGTPDEERQFKGVRAMNYVADVALEVLHALKSRTMDELSHAVPPRVSFWLVADRDHLAPRYYAGVHLLLIDVRRFGRLVSAAQPEPVIVFEIMNRVWTTITKVLDARDAVVNNYMGDAALAVRNVYRDCDARIQTTVKCAFEVAECFRPAGELRNELRGYVTAHSELHRDKKTELLDLVDQPDFGVRIVIAAPQQEECYFGVVGDPRERWQHTILSTYMNGAARAESHISTWEKDRRFHRLTPTHGDVYLLWGADVPDVTPYRCVPPQEYLGHPRPEIPEIREGWEIYKLVPADEPMEPHRTGIREWFAGLKSVV